MSEKQTIVKEIDDFFYMTDKSSGALGVLLSLLQRTTHAILIINPEKEKYYSFDSIELAYEWIIVSQGLCEQKITILYPMNNNSTISYFVFGKSNTTVRYYCAHQDFYKKLREKELMYLNSD